MVNCEDEDGAIVTRKLNNVHVFMYRKEAPKGGQINDYNFSKE